MCIVIDINVFASVFKPDAQNFKEYEPIFKWIVEKRKGKVVYGGSKYLKELPQSYRSILLELSKSGLTAYYPDTQAIDDYEEQIIQSIDDKRLNDPHIIAILGVTGCLLLCSEDSKSFKFIKDRQFYPKKYKGLKIYTKNKHKHLLCEENIVSICR